jgi:hypothetical protein
MNRIADIVSRTSADEADAHDSSGIDARKRRELAELLLPALFASLAQLPPDPRTVLSLDGGDSAADGWRPGASGVTPSSPPAEILASAPGVEELQSASPLGERITARIDGGELGQIRLTVERTSEGVAVRVAAADPATAARAELERNVLEQSLRAAGLSVASITVVNDVDGTLLAQTDIDQRLNVLDTTGDSVPEDGPPKAKRPNKRLNLTG